LTVHFLQFFWKKKENNVYLKNKENNNILGKKKCWHFNSDITDSL
jgi:hypothetical protein